MSTTTPEFARQASEPLYPKILFNRPVTRGGAGRLLVAGGHLGELSQPTALNQLALAAGVGECRVVMPDVLAKLVGGAPGVYFAAATESGSLAREALGRILELSEEADALVLGSSLSANSNTTMLTERLATEVQRPLVLVDEALTALAHNQDVTAHRPDTLIIATMAEVFKLCGALGIAINVRPGGGLINKLEIIQALAAASKATYAVFGTETIIAAGGSLSVTPVNYRLSVTPALFYAVLSTYWIQNRSQPLAGLTTGAYVIRRVSELTENIASPSVTQLTKALTEVTRQEDF